MKQLLIKFLKFLLVVYVFVFAYEWWRPMPEDFAKVAQSYSVPEKGVRFYAVIEKKDKKGNVVQVRTIEERYKELLRNAGHMVLIGEEYVPEGSTSTAVTLLSEKHTRDRHVALALITDKVSTRYGGIVSQPLEALRAAGTLVVETDMNAMPDSNLFYTSFWRPFFSWWGNSPKGGWLMDPIAMSQKEFTLRTWLSFFNMKANESHILFADSPVGKEVKLVTLFSSADISAPRGSTGATALEVDDKVWSEVLRRETSIFDISGSGLPSYGGSEIDDASGTLRATMIDTGRLRSKLISLIGEMKQNDHLYIASRFISDRAIIGALKDAANHNVVIQIILDPNDSVMGQKLYGMPNRPVAKELTGGTSGGITVKWCDPRQLPCEARMILGETASSTFMLVGSADLTRRDTAGFNLESVVLVEGVHDFTASREAKVHFNRLWANDGGDYTVPYEAFADDSIWRSSVYRMMERTGFAYY
jgi:hypothetical protein